MRVVIQRVKHAHAAPKDTPHQPLATIRNGIWVLCGFVESDNPLEIEQVAQKVRSLRIFSDSEGKMNLSSVEAGASMLLTPQFTLYAECKYGNRPSFSKAAPKPRAKEYYEHFIQVMQRLHGPDKVQATEFGSDLVVDLINDGPVTFHLDSAEIL